MAVKLVSSTKIYLDARKLLDIILDIVPNFPRAYKFTIGAKLQEIGVNLMQEIAAAYINKDKAETVKHLTEFQAEFETMKTLMRIAGEREWIKGRGKFASIIELMDEMVDRFIVEYYKGEDIDDLRYLCRVVILHSPEKNCERHSPLSYWEKLDKNKSLFTNGEGKGVAIGNLFAQIFANFLLNTLDWFIENEGIEHHGRYVDDFYCIHKDKEKLLALMPKIRELLAKLGLRLNEKKFYLQHYSKGVEFTGSIVKPGRVYTCNRTITNFIAAVRRLNKANNERQVLHAVCSINSYLGLLRHTNEYATRI